MFIGPDELGTTRDAEKADLLVEVLNKACRKYKFAPEAFLVFKGKVFDVIQIVPAGSERIEVMPIVQLDEGGARIGHVIEHLLGKELIPGIPTAPK